MGLILKLTDEILNILGCFGETVPHCILQTSF